MAQPELTLAYERLGYTFERPELLLEALTHPSVSEGRAGRSDYDRMEFLGDRVLGLVIATRLYQEDEEADAGRLAVRFNTLVNRQTVAEVARELGLGEFLVLARSERQTGGRQKQAILANAGEAVIGAIYLDGGLSVAQTFIERCWSERLAAAPEAEKDAKTRLQEWAQQGSGELPSYEIIDRTGPDHAPVFTIEVRLSSVPPCSGQGTSRRAAEMAAATAMLAAVQGDD